MRYTFCSACYGPATDLQRNVLELCSTGGLGEAVASCTYSDAPTQCCLCTSTASHITNLQQVVGGAIWNPIYQEDTPSGEHPGAPIARGRLGDTTASCTYSDAHLNALRHCTRGISAALQITVSLGERFGASPTREGLGDTIPRCSQALTILLTSASGKRRGGVLTPMVSQVQSISIVVSVVM